MSFAVIVPTLNASDGFPDWIEALRSQSLKPQCVVVIDSSSSDNTLLLAEQEGFTTFKLARHEFNHGATRDLALRLAPDAEFLVYLTQDATLANPAALDAMIAGLSDPTVGAAYGRQLPRHGAGPLEAHARLFNYPSVPQKRTLQDRDALGLKVIFMSNSFSAYRRTALEQVGGFPTNVIMGEDTYVAGKMLLAGWKVAYVPSAMVYHSHAYSVLQEFSRYFDIGVLHAREPWLLEQFGTAGGEGKRFLVSELRHLWPQHPHLVPTALIRNALKLVGYRTGLWERRLKLNWKRRVSMHRGYWTESMQ